MASYTLTLPETVTYSIEHQSNGYTVIRATGDLSKRNWQRRWSLIERLEQYACENEQAPYYGCLIVNCSVDGRTPSNDEFAAFIKRWDDVKEWKQIDDSQWAVWLLDSDEDPGSAWEHLDRFKNINYHNWRIEASTPPARPKRVLHRGWLLIQSRVQKEHVKGWLERFGKITAIYMCKPAIHKVTPGVYIALYDQHNVKPHLIDDLLPKLYTLKDELTIRPLTEEDINLLA